MRKLPDLLQQQIYCSLYRDTVASQLPYPEVHCQHDLINWVPIWIKMCCFQRLKEIQTFLSCLEPKWVNALNLFWLLLKPFWLSLHHAMDLNSVLGKNRSGTLEWLSRTDCLRSSMPRIYVLITVSLVIFSLSFFLSIVTVMNHQDLVLFRVCRILQLFIVLDMCKLGLDIIFLLLRNCVLC